MKVTWSESLHFELRADVTATPHLLAFLGLTFLRTESVVRPSIEKDPGREGMQLLQEPRRVAVDKHFHWVKTVHLVEQDLHDSWFLMK